RSADLHRAAAGGAGVGSDLRRRAAVPDTGAVPLRAGLRSVRVRLRLGDRRRAVRDRRDRLPDQLLPHHTHPEGRLMSDVVDQATPLPPLPVKAMPAKATRRRRGGRVGHVPWPVYVMLVVAVLISVFPLYYMFVIASAGASAVTSSPPRLYPGTAFFDLAAKVFDTVPFFQSLINSVIVSLTI